MESFLGASFSPCIYHKPQRGSRPHRGHFAWKCLLLTRRFAPSARHPLPATRQAPPGLPWLPRALRDAPSTGSAASDFSRACVSAHIRSLHPGFPMRPRHPSSPPHCAPPNPPPDPVTAAPHYQAKCPPSSLCLWSKCVCGPHAWKHVLYILEYMDLYRIFAHEGTCEELACGAGGSSRPAAEVAGKSSDKNPPSLLLRDPAGRTRPLPSQATGPAANRSHRHPRRGPELASKRGTGPPPPQGARARAWLPRPDAGHDSAFANAGTPSPRRLHPAAQGEGLGGKGLRDT